MNKRSFKLEPYLFILPAFLLTALFLIIPLIELIRYSFAKVSIMAGFEKWVGLENYKMLFSPEFSSTLWRTCIWLVGSMALMIVFGLAVALLLNKTGPGIKIFRSLAILPYLIPPAFGSIMWLWVVNPQFGFINSLLLKLGFIDKPIGFLSVSTAMTTVIIVRAWKGIPFMVMTLLAALQTLPAEVEEAAKMDGATGWQYLWHIILPSIRPVLLISSVILGTWTLKIFDTVYVLTQGGPYHATEIISIDMFNKAFVASDIGQASAVGVATMAIVLILSVFTLRRKEDD